jgi:hypothetical protein
MALTYVALQWKVGQLQSHNILPLIRATSCQHKLLKELDTSIGWLLSKVYSHVHWRAGVPNEPVTLTPGAVFFIGLAFAHWLKASGAVPCRTTLDVHCSSCPCCLLVALATGTPCCLPCNWYTGQIHYSNTYSCHWA